MMMGVGLLFMLLIGLVVIGLPVLIVVLIAGGGLAALLKSLSSGSQPQPLPRSTSPLARRPHQRKCPTAGARFDRVGMCASCGAALT
jgi:hypothetical protein